MIINSNKKNLNQWETYHKCAHKLSYKMLVLRTNRETRHFMVCQQTCKNGLRARDKRLARMISCIHHTNDHRQYCHVGNTAQHCRLGLVQDSDFAGDPADSKSTSGGVLCIFGSRTFVSTSWMCKKHTSVSHSCTESEIISLDAGLRMDGLTALDQMGCGDGSVTFLEEHRQAAGNRLRKKVRSTSSNTKLKRRGNRDVDELSNVDHVVTNESSPQCGAQLYIFEDNEAVIKMIIKGRSPTMRHVSRTHRVALDGLFERIILDSKFQIKYVDTKNQLADMLTKSSFTRDEWNHLLRWFNIMNFSMFSCSHFLSIKKPSNMSKRAQERRTEEEHVATKSRSACLVSRILSAKQSSSLDSGASYSLDTHELGQNSVFTSTVNPVRGGV